MTQIKQRTQLNSKSKRGSRTDAALHAADKLRTEPLQSCPALNNPTGCTCQGPLSTGFSRPEYWSGLPGPPPGRPPGPGIPPTSLTSLAGRFFTTSAPGKPL